MESLLGRVCAGQGCYGFSMGLYTLTFDPFHDRLKVSLRCLIGRLSHKNSEAGADFLTLTDSFIFVAVMCQTGLWSSFEKDIFE